MSYKPKHMREDVGERIAELRAKMEGYERDTDACLMEGDALGALYPCMLADECRAEIERLENR